MQKAVFTMIAALMCSPAVAQQADMSAFETGPVFTEFAAHAPVESAREIPADTKFSIAYDVDEKAGEGERNRRLETPARFMNMHVAAGVPQENISLVVVVHGRAVFDLATDEALAARQMPANASGSMVRAMLDEDIRFVVCGQSAAALGVKGDELIDGVEMDLSAMTAHALLQQEGYTLNPF